MKRKLSLIMFTVLMALVMMITPVFAVGNENFSEKDSLEVTITNSDGQTTSTFYDLSDLTSIATNENGILPRISIGKDELKNGYTMTYSDSDGSAFYITGGSKVTFTVKLKSSAHVVMGYKNSSGNKIQTYDDTAKKNTTKISIADTGNYRFYITNVSSDTIKITGGSISF